LASRHNQSAAAGVTLRSVGRMLRGGCQSNGQDMTDADDPIAFELFRNAIFSIADEMALTIFRMTCPGVLKDNMDYCVFAMPTAGWWRRA
jgi:hypothetical protein